MMKGLGTAVALVGCLVLAVGLASPPVISGPRRPPGVPPMTVPASGLRAEWAFRPAVPLAGSAATQVPTVMPVSFRNLVSGTYLAVHNGIPILARDEIPEFRFEPRENAKVLGYQRWVAIRNRAGQYLIAARLGERPVLTWSSRLSHEWAVLGGQAGMAVRVDAPVALGNAMVRLNELIYCPGAMNALDWDFQCPPAPSSGGEQPTGVAPSPKR